MVINMLDLGHFLAILAIFNTSLAYVYEEELYYDTFPDGFAWGVATAAYQIEGGWNEGGKGLNIWDVFTTQPGNILDGSDGTVACDSYHKYEEDVQLIRDMGLSHYRFSIAWSRIIPDGIGTVSQEGVQYYKNLISSLKANGITPVVTLYHWDLPQQLENLGGWLESDVANWFEQYAIVCFQEFGDDVKLWITLNEPRETAVSGYGTGGSAPGVEGIGDKVYIAAHNQIRAHAKAYRAYHENFFPEQQGRIGITLNVNWAEPQDPNNPADVEAAETRLQFDFGWFARPILVDGQYPDIMRQKIDAKSASQGFLQSRLPRFTSEEAAEIAQSSDFLGLNIYTANVIYPKESPITDVSYFADSDTDSYQDASWYKSGSEWLSVTAFGMRPLLNWVHDQFGDYQMFITENGFSDKQGNVDDLQRIYFLKHYINEFLKAVRLDGQDVAGYFAWSLIDNFEWSSGYSVKFGLHYVDFDDPERPRIPKESSRYFASVAAANGFVPSDTPCSNE